jgi:hypothetical protein
VWSWLRTAGPGELLPGASLSAGQSLSSPSAAYHLDQVHLEVNVKGKRVSLHERRPLLLGVAGE